MEEEGRNSGGGGRTRFASRRNGISTNIKWDGEEGAKVEDAYKFFLDKGMQPTEISAVLGNLMLESRLDPNKGNINGAYGIARWSGKRLNNLLEYSKKNNKAHTDLDTQLEFVWHEMKGETSVERTNHLKKLENSDNLYDKVKILGENYERPPEKYAYNDKRFELAKNIFTTIDPLLLKESSQLTPEEKLELARGGVLGDNLRRIQRTNYINNTVDPSHLRKSSTSSSSTCTECEQNKNGSQGVDYTTLNNVPFHDLLDNDVDYSKAIVKDLDSFKRERGKEFMSYHRNAKTKKAASCYGGALNCTQGYLQSAFKVPGARTILANKNIDTREYDFDKSGSIDAWEANELWVKSGLGKAVYTHKGKETKYGKNPKYVGDANIPNDLDVSKLTIGTFLGQSEPGPYINEDLKRKYPNATRHQMVVVGFLEDGKPILEDSGHISTLDNLAHPYLGFNGGRGIKTAFVPNEYSELTFENIKNNIEKRKQSLTKPIVPLKPYQVDNPSIKEIEKGWLDVREKLAIDKGINVSFVDDLAQVLPGLAYKESGVYGEITDGVLSSPKKSLFSVIDSDIGNEILKPTLKYGKSFATAELNLFKKLLGEEEFKKPAYKYELEAFKKALKEGDVSKTREIFAELNKSGLERRRDVSNASNSSVGAFAIKENTAYNKKKLGIDKKDLYGEDVDKNTKIYKGAQAALSILVDKYKEVRKKYKDLNHKQALKLAVISYNNNGKVKDEEFVKYYIKEDHPELKDLYFDEVSSFLDKYKKEEASKDKDVSLLDKLRVSLASMFKFEDGGTVTTVLPDENTPLNNGNIEERDSINYLWQEYEKLLKSRVKELSYMDRTTAESVPKFNYEKYFGGSNYSTSSSNTDPLLAMSMNMMRLGLEAKREKDREEKEEEESNKKALAQRKLEEKFQQRSVLAGLLGESLVQEVKKVSRNPKLES